jgi:hypothetical protein
MPSLTELASPEDPRLALILRANLALVSINDRLVDHWSAHARAKDLTGAQAKVLLALSAPGGGDDARACTPALL